jgi:hypothetical protein
MLAMEMVCSIGLRYPAQLIRVIPWIDAELEIRWRTCNWMLVSKAAWLLPPGYPEAPFLSLLPSVQGGCLIRHPRVVLTQALAKHLEQLVALPLGGR